MEGINDPLVRTSPRFYCNSDVSVTATATFISEFTDEGGCIVTETSESL